MQIYGSVGPCKICGDKEAKLHCKIGGKMACQKCYGKKRMKNPKEKKKHRERMKMYMRTYRRPVKA